MVRRHTDQCAYPGIAGPDLLIARYPLAPGSISPITRLQTLQPKLSRLSTSGPYFMAISWQRVPGKGFEPLSFRSESAPLTQRELIRLYAALRMLYPLSYPGGGGKMTEAICQSFPPCPVRASDAIRLHTGPWQVLGSNQPPSDFQSDALPTELTCLTREGLTPALCAPSPYTREVAYMRTWYASRSSPESGTGWGVPDSLPRGPRRI